MDAAQRLEVYRAKVRARMTPEVAARFDAIRQACASEGCHGMCAGGCRLLRR